MADGETKELRKDSSFRVPGRAGWGLGHDPAPRLTPPNSSHPPKRSWTCCQYFSHMRQEDYNVPEPGCQVFLSLAWFQAFAPSGATAEGVGDAAIWALPVFGLRPTWTWRHWEGKGKGREKGLLIRRGPWHRMTTRLPDLEKPSKLAPHIFLWRKADLNKKCKSWRLTICMSHLLIQLSLKCSPSNPFCQVFDVKLRAKKPKREKQKKLYCKHATQGL